MIWKQTLSVIDPYGTQNFDFLSLFDENSSHLKSLRKMFATFDEENCL